MNDDDNDYISGNNSPNSARSPRERSPRADDIKRKFDNFKKISER